MVAGAAGSRLRHEKEENPATHTKVRTALVYLFVNLKEWRET